jgi:drug/metabolite transporter (DMT)-like permease
MPQLSNDLTGYAAGVATSALWTVTSVIFTGATRRLGPTVVNATRILSAVTLLAITFHLRTGDWVPDIRPWQVLLLAASGVIGLAIGDQALFTAFVDIGPRLTMLLMTTSPLLAALFGWLALGETLEPAAWLGILLTVGGVAWVVAERPAAGTGCARPHRLRGVILGVLAAAAQAGGLLLSKQGMGHGWLPREEHLDPQAATLVRVFFAALIMLPIVAARARFEQPRQAVGGYPVRPASARVGVLLSLAGGALGLYLGVWLSLVAGDRVPLGIAQTLCSLSPVFILPVARVAYGERITWRAVVGALAAVAGVALLFLPLR